MIWNLNKRKTYSCLGVLMAISIPAHADVHNGPAAPADNDLSYQVYNELLSECIESDIETSICVRSVNREFAQETQKRREIEA